MYEDYRTELVSELVKDFAPEEVRKIMKDVDKVSAKYSFETHETALAPTGANEEIIRQYLACRSVEGMSKNTMKVKFSINASSIWSNTLRAERAKASISSAVLTALIPAFKQAGSNTFSQR